MPATPALLYRGAAATTSTTLKTTTTSTVLTDIVISNSSSSQQYVTMTVDGVNILPAVPISANTVVTIQPKTVIATSKVIAGFATSTSVTFHISGVEIS
jgi:hypothetical protein